MVALQQMAITTGIMISFWIDYGTNYIGGTGETQSDAAWLIPICLQLAPALILFVGMWFMPFSPRWLLHHGHEEEARTVLANLRDLPEDHELLQLEFLEIKAQSLFEHRTMEKNFPALVAQKDWWSLIVLEGKNFGLLFKNWGMFKRVIVATVTMFFQQFTGINAGKFYILSSVAEMPVRTSSTWRAITNFFQFCTTLLRSSSSSAWTRTPPRFSLPVSLVSSCLPPPFPRFSGLTSSAVSLCSLSVPSAWL